jgi:hypothetical protein
MGSSGIFAGTAACCVEKAKNTPFGRTRRRAMRKPFLVTRERQPPGKEDLPQAFDP